MPSVPQTWFQSNFGKTPWDRTDDRSYGVGVLGEKVPMVRPFTPYDLTPGNSLFTNYNDEVYDSWRTANDNAAQASLALGQQQQAAAQKRMTQQQAAAAAARNAVRQALIKARTVYDNTALNAPTPEAVKAAQAKNGDYITPEWVKQDLGRNLTTADVFDTGRTRHDVQAVMDNRPRNRYEVALDGRVVGKTDTVTPIVQNPRYKDGAGEAMYYASQKRLNSSQIAEWQLFFQATGGLTSGGYIPGAWDANTQKAMYQFMGAANSMGQKVEDLKAMAASAMKNGGQMPWQNTSSGSGSGPRSTTQRVVNITSMAKGAEIIRAYLQQELGRDPDQAEIAAYVRLLNGQERKNPTIVTTTYSGNSSSTTTKEGNVDAGNTAHDLVTQQMKDELAGRRTMKYMDALMGMGG